jgi:hypothetical protein
MRQRAYCWMWFSRIWTTPAPLLLYKTSELLSVCQESVKYPERGKLDHLRLVRHCRANTPKSLFRFEYYNHDHVSQARQAEDA